MVKNYKILGLEFSNDIEAFTSIDVLWSLDTLLFQKKSSRIIRKRAATYSSKLQDKFNKADGILYLYLRNLDVCLQCIPTHLRYPILNGI